MRTADQSIRPMASWGKKLLLACAFAGVPALSLAQAGNADLDALVKAARAEGEVTFYSAATEHVANKLRDSFGPKYGIKVQFVRVSSTGLQQRFSTESESGNTAADLLFLAGTAVPYATDGAKRGWVEPIAEAGLPAIKGGEFPAKFINNGMTATVQVAPWGLAYNTDKVKDGAPKDWPDILNPRWNGQILVTNPSASDALVDFWTVILDKYGPSFFDKLRAQSPRRYADNTQTIQALGAGEGSLALPMILPTVESVRSKGAPLGLIPNNYTTGVEMHVILTARSRSKHPNAARLLANYVLTLEGNKVYNSDPGIVTMFDTAGLPKDYQAPKPGAAARRQEFAKLLGF